MKLITTQYTIIFVTLLSRLGLIDLLCYVPINGDASGFMWLIYVQIKLFTLHHCVSIGKFVSSSKASLEFRY